MSTEPLPLETYAEALANVLSQRDVPLENVLGALGVSFEAFHRADAYWNERLREAHRYRKGVLAMKFAAAFASARHRLGIFHEGDVPAPPPARAEERPGFVVNPPRLAMNAPIAPVAPSAPVAPVPAEPPPPRHTLGETIGLSSEPAAKTPTLPFQPGAPATLTPEPTRSPAQPPAPKLNTGTAHHSDDLPPRPATPWGSGVTERPKGARMNLAYFAALAVELAQNPPDRAAVLRRYGLNNEEEYRYTAAAFSAQMQAQPEIRDQYDSLVARYRGMGR